jgi:Fe2+ or Zn2+ uptake regulation protein
MHRGTSCICCCVIIHNSNCYYFPMSENIRNRHSKQRETILKIIQNTYTHPTAEWIYEKVRNDIPRISLGTVYRNLRFMSTQGIIRELQIGDSQTRYDSHHQDHGHFICIRCQMIFDLENIDTSHRRRSIERKIQCHIISYRLDYFGICHQCRKDERKSKKIKNHERNGKKTEIRRP